ncbi:S8 family serine peptidase [Paenibacillus graminis]|uniref:S8 family serine peptidase n=1 Tax=Paenibacillus graminis TaxID=189425 RepID=UPI00047070D1|nr:S8 family serine peptidase [Paenibacillus graminis]
MEPIVVIIDSGIRADLFGDCLIDFISFQKDGKESDSLGHGTACALVIKSICTNIRLISISVLDSEGFTSSDILRNALEYCLTINCNIINLSLSLLDNENFEIEEVCKKLLKQNKIVISAVRNRYERSEPAIFNSVIGVRGTLFSSPNEFWFNANESIQLITDLTPVFTNPELGKYFMFSGNSKAAAVGSGLVAKAISSKEILDINDIYNNLSTNCTKTSWLEEDIDSAIFSYGNKTNNGNIEWNTHYQKIYEAIALASISVGRTIEENSLNASDNLFEMGIMLPEIVIPLLLELEQEFGTRIELHQIKPFMLQSINSIYNTLRGVRNKTVKNDIEYMEIHGRVT